ncbi:hypothetical protein Tco_0699900 [Tanacetum coccineum]
MIMRFNEIHKFSDGTLQQIDEALDYRVKEFKVNRMNPGLNTRFWTRKDVDRSKEFMFAIQKWLKTRRIFRNLECFIGGRIREETKDYMREPNDHIISAIKPEHPIDTKVATMKNGNPSRAIIKHLGVEHMMISKKAQRSHESKEQSSKITTCSTETDHEE